jgi:hypothetical protein
MERDDRLLESMAGDREASRERRAQALRALTDACENERPASISTNGAWLEYIRILGIDIRPEKTTVIYRQAGGTEDQSVDLNDVSNVIQ